MLESKVKMCKRLSQGQKVRKQDTENKASMPWEGAMKNCHVSFQMAFGKLIVQMPFRSARTLLSGSASFYIAPVLSSLHAENCATVDRSSSASMRCIFPIFPSLSQLTQIKIDPNPMSCFRGEKRKQ